MCRDDTLKLLYFITDLGPSSRSWRHLSLVFAVASRFVKALVNNLLSQESASVKRVSNVDQPCP